MKNYKFLKKRNLIKNLKILIAVFAVVMVWRGSWGLMDLYLFPGNHVLSYWLSTILGIVILLLDDGFLTELKEH